MEVIAPKNLYPGTYVFLNTEENYFGKIESLIEQIDTPTTVVHCYKKNIFRPENLEKARYVVKPLGKTRTAPASRHLIQPTYEI